MSSVPTVGMNGEGASGHMAYHRVSSEGTSVDGDDLQCYSRPDNTSLFANVNSDTSSNSLSLELRDMSSSTLASQDSSNSLSSHTSLPSSISNQLNSDFSTDSTRSQNKTDKGKDIRTDSGSWNTSEISISSSCNTADQPLYSTYKQARDYGFSMKEVHEEKDLVVLDTQLPPHLTERQFDAVLLYCDGDQREAILFKEVIEKFIVLGDGGPAQIGTLDKTVYLGWIQSKTKHLEEAVKRSTYMFLFMTDNFVRDAWAELQKDECLQESIENPDKKWCVVPVHTMPRRERHYTIPWGLRSLKGHFVDAMIKQKTFRDFKDIDIDAVHHSDLEPFFQKSMTRLLDSRLTMKLDRIKTQRQALGEWGVCERRRREAVLRSVQEAERLQKLKLKRDMELQREQEEEERQKAEQKIREGGAEPRVKEEGERQRNATTTQGGGSSVLSSKVMDVFNVLMKHGMSADAAMEQAKQTCSQTPNDSQVATSDTAGQVVIINNPGAVSVGRNNTILVNPSQDPDPEPERVIIERTAPGKPSCDPDDETQVKVIQTTESL